MGSFRDRGRQNHCFLNFSARSPRENLGPNATPKNPSNNYPKRILWSSRKLDPFFRPPNSSPERILAISFSTTPVEENAPWAFQRRPEGLPRIATTPKYGVQKGLQARNYRALISRRKNMKNAKNDDPCRRSATSLSSGDARKSLVSGKKVVILHLRLFFLDYTESVATHIK